MEKKGQIINFQAISQSRATEPGRVTQSGSLVRFRAYRILTPPTEIPIYGSLAEILDGLNWNTDEILINTAEVKEDVVESREVTAPLKDVQGKVGELIITPESVQLWRDKGYVLITKRLPTQGEQNQVISASNQLEEIALDQTEKVRVIESVGVFADQTDNPYLQAPADLKKAA